MPPSSTDITDDDFSILLELNSDQFTYSDAGDEQSSSSIADTSTPPKPRRKRKLAATSTWGFARDPLPGEPSRDGKNKIWYCSMCEWDSASLTSARVHLAKQHGIEI